ncbi:MAG: hypothetical protein H8E17_03540 [Deltaproteobacteria bacterium]|nr:hypothetical protein [Deltaproteobacteria bacterium]
MSKRLRTFEVVPEHRRNVWLTNRNIVDESPKVHAFAVVDMVRNLSLIRVLGSDFVVGQTAAANKALTTANVVWH